MSAVGLFLQDPLGFMSKNVVVVGWDGPANDTLNGAVYDMTFVTKAPATACAKQLGKSLGLYFLVPAPMVKQLPAATPDGRTFKAYFCPYQQNNILGTTISKGADYMFTATMDGCSLGIGAAATDGSRLIYHDNRGGQAEDQRTELGLVMGASLQSVIEPKDYRFEMGQGVLKSTTFGLRLATNNKWSFHTQIYFEDATKNPRTYYLRDLKTAM
jgi:hypothetical protein